MLGLHDMLTTPTRCANHRAAGVVCKLAHTQAFWVYPPFWACPSGSAVLTVPVSTPTHDKQTAAKTTRQCLQSTHKTSRGPASLFRQELWGATWHAAACHMPFNTAILLCGALLRGATTVLVDAPESPSNRQQCLCPPLFNSNNVSEGAKIQQTLLPHKCQASGGGQRHPRWQSCPAPRSADLRQCDSVYNDPTRQQRPPKRECLHELALMLPSFGSMVMPSGQPYHKACGMRTPCALPTLMNYPEAHLN
jgi:hypothetical protein